jgi:hypothetical protein
MSLHQTLAVDGATPTWAAISFTDAPKYLS